MPTLRKRRSTAAAHADADAANTSAGDGNGGGQLLLQAGGEEATAKNDDVGEAALAAAKETRRAKAKKRRLEAKQRLPRFEVLVEQGLMPLVVDLLSDSPKGLFSLYCVSKRSQPFLTREVVVKSSVYRGGNSREIMSDLVRRIEKRSIFLPSAVRMLRLINGRRCENLSDCWGYNLRTQKHTNLATAHYTSRPFGLCICKDCVKGLTTSIPYSHFASSNERVDDRTLDVPFYDSQGKRQGPVVTTREIKQIEKAYRGADERMPILNQILKEMDDDADDDEDAVIKSVVETHKDAESKADAFIDARSQIESQRYNTSQNERSSKKLAKMKEISLFSRTASTRVSPWRWNGRRAMGTHPRRSNAAFRGSCFRVCSDLLAARVRRGSERRQTRLDACILLPRRRGFFALRPVTLPCCLAVRTIFSGQSMRTLQVRLRASSTCFSHLPVEMLSGWMPMHRHPVVIFVRGSSRFVLAVGLIPYFRS